MPVSRPPPISRRVTGNYLSGVGCGVPYGSLTYDHLAGGEVADVEGSSRVVSVDVEHDALCPTWRQLVLGFWSPWLYRRSRCAVSGVCDSFISARRRVLISRKPVSGRRERKTSVLRPKRSRVVAAAG